MKNNTEEALKALDELHADAQLYQDCDELGSKQSYKEYETIRTALQRQVEIEGLLVEMIETRKMWGGYAPRDTKALIDFAKYSDKLEKIMEK